MVDKKAKSKANVPVDPLEGIVLKPSPVGGTKTKYDFGTPWQELGVNERTIRANMEAFQTLLVNHVYDPVRIIEGMGGFGNETRVLQKVFPGCNAHLVWDHDEICCAELRKIKGIKVSCQDFYEAAKNLTLNSDDLLVLSINMFTITHWLRHKPLFELGAGQIVVPDLAKGKLHLHTKAYGISKPDYDLYAKRFGGIVFKDTGYKLVARVPSVKAVTFLLFRLEA